MKSKRYLVTGGAGFIGSAITRKLLLGGCNVRIIDNLQRGKINRLEDVKKDLEFISADIRDQKGVIKAAKNCDGIIHLAYVNGTKFFYSSPDLVIDIAINGMLNVLKAGKLNSINEFFLASSSEVYQTPYVIPTPEEVPLIVPDPYNPRFSYGGGKILSELMTIHMGKNYFKRSVIFRPHNVYGPDMGEEHVIPELTRKIEKLKKVKNNNVLNIQGSGKETRSYIYIDDFAEGFDILRKFGKNQTTYNIGTNNEINSQELAILIGKIIGVKMSIKTNPLAEGSTLRRCPDIKKIKKLGFKPKVSLNIGLKRTIDWYLSHPNLTL